MRNGSKLKTYREPATRLDKLMTTLYMLELASPWNLSPGDISRLVDRWLVKNGNTSRRYE